jgi:hypothetical protein
MKEHSAAGMAEAVLCFLNCKANQISAKGIENGKLQLTRLQMQRVKKRKES